MDLIKVSEYGLLGCVMLSVMGIFFFIIKENLRQTKSIADQAAKERELFSAQASKEREMFLTQGANERTIFYTRMDQVGKSLQSVCDCLATHDKRADERGQLVKEEHTKMIETLVEHGKILARINGFKHE